MLRHQSLKDVLEVQVAPESVEVHIFPAFATAASLVPSLDEVMLYQSCVLPTEVSLVQVAPESVDVQIYPSVFPPPSAAASFVPSLDEVMQLQVFVLPTEVRSVQNQWTSRCSLH